MKRPFVELGRGYRGERIIGGAFELADSHGLPLAMSIELARERNGEISLLHYFASALANGWDDRQTFGKIKEALSDIGEAHFFQLIEKICISFFNAYHKEGMTSQEVGRGILEGIEP